MPIRAWYMFCVSMAATLAVLVAFSYASTAEPLHDEASLLQSHPSVVRARSVAAGAQLELASSANREEQKQKESLHDEVEESDFHQDFVATQKAAKVRITSASKSMTSSLASKSMKHATDPATAGNPACPCVEADYPSNATTPDGTLLVTFELPGGTGTSTVKAAYPADLGTYCAAWDDGTNPQCTGEVNPSWCAQKWCYVDLCNCDLDVMPKHIQYVEGATYDGRALFYSYRTCGEIDSYSSSENDLACPNYKSEYECSTQEQCAWGSSVGCVHTDYVTECGYDLNSGAFRRTSLVGMLSTVLLLAFPLM